MKLTTAASNPKLWPGTSMYTTSPPASSFGSGRQHSATRVNCGWLVGARRYAQRRDLLGRAPSSIHHRDGLACLDRSFGEGSRDLCREVGTAAHDGFVHLRGSVETVPLRIVDAPHFLALYDGRSFDGPPLASAVYLRSSCAPDTGPKTKPDSISSSVRFQHIFARSTSSAPEGGLLSDCLMDPFNAMLVAMNSASDVCAGASISLNTPEYGMSNATGNPVMYRRASSSSGHGMASSAIRVRRPSTRR